MSFNSEVLALSPIGYWKLDETSGVTAADSSGNSKDLTYISSPTLGEPSLILEELGTGYSISLNGSTQKAKRAESNWPGAYSSGTIIAFINTANTGSNNYIVTSGDTSSTKILSFYTSSSGGGALRVYGKNSTQQEYITGTTNVCDGNTHMVAVSSTGAAGEWKLYVDGVLDTISETVGGNSGMWFSSINDRDNLIIGGYENISTGYFNGKIDGVAIFGSELTASQILSLYNASQVYPIVADATNNQNGSFGGAPSIQQSSLIPSDTSGKSVLFGSGDYIDLTSYRISPDESAWTAIVVFKFTDGGAGEFPLILLNDSTEEMRLSVYQNKIQVYANSTWDDTGITVATNFTYFLAVTRSGTTVKFYKNSDAAVTSSNGANYSGISVKYIGTDDSQTNSFVGNIDDTIIYNKVLSDIEISGLYSRFLSSYSDYVTSLGPIAWWKLDETSGTTASDSSGNGYDGTYTNGPTLGQTSLIASEPTGKSVSFDGVNDYITKAGTAALQITGDMSISCFVNTTGIGGGSQRVVVFGEDSEAEADNFLYSLGLQDEGSVQYYHEYGAGLNEILTLGVGSISNNDTYHIVLTRDDLTKTVTLYIDGSVVDSGTYTNSPSGGTTANLFIGKSASSSLYFDGTLDDVQIYNKVLVSQEISRLYDTSIG